MQQHPVATVGDSGCDRGHQPGGQALTAMSRIRADGADLGPPRWVQSLAGHGHQGATSPNAQIGAEFDRPPAKRARFGALDQIEDVRQIGGSQPDSLRVMLFDQIDVDQLHPDPDQLCRPGFRWMDVRAADGEADAWSEELGDVGPTPRIPWVGQRHERRDVR